MLRALALLLLVACGGGYHPVTPGATPAANHVDQPAGPTVAVALVFNGNETWVGNDDLTPEGDPSRFIGALKDLEAALDGADFAHSLPAGSLGTAIAYQDTAKIVAPMGPITGLRGASLGTQKDYYYKAGTNLVAGIELAQIELDKTTATKKVMIVVGDGNDTDNSSARTRLPTLKAQLARTGITVVAIIYKGALSDDKDVVSLIAPDSRTIPSTTALPLAVAKVLHDCCKP